MRIKTQDSSKNSSFTFIFLTATVCKVMGQVSQFGLTCFLKHYQFQNRNPSFIYDPFPKSPRPCQPLWHVWAT